eukprot:m.173127 g.173127  ORF g.173127 m.173127 type:complete len:51 (+) comp39093_c0_seq8:1308-1460(+)
MLAVLKAGRAVNMIHFYCYTFFCASSLCQCLSKRGKKNASNMLKNAFLSL